MLSKEIFIDTINFIRTRQINQDRLNNIIREEFEDNIFWPYGKYETQMIKVLQDVFRDSNEWISWYIYEADFGENFDCAYESDGITKINLKTPEDLYNFLVKNMEDKE